MTCLGPDNVHTGWSNRIILRKFTVWPNNPIIFLNRYSLRPSIVWSLLPTHHGDGYDDGEGEVPLGVDDLLGDVIEVVPAVVRPQPGVERYRNVAE